MTEIIVKYEDRVIERVITEKTCITIGRNTENDIVLDNRGVSRRHAVIEIDPRGNTIIIDNESLNGTYVNGRRVEEEIINDGDSIQIGRYVLEFKCGVQPTAAVAAAMEATARTAQPPLAGEIAGQRPVQEAGGKEFPWGLLVIIVILAIIVVCRMS